MLECRKVSCTRGNKILFHNLNFTSNKQSITLISGCNGSGKTSLLRIIAGIIRPTSGSVQFHNDNVYNSYSYFSFVTYIGHKNACCDNLTVLENMEFWAGLRDTTELILPAIYYFQLQHLLNIKYDNLSAGWKRRVALSRLIIYNSTLWMIDEPFTNLDKNSQNLITSLISTRAERGGIIIITGHSEQINLPNYQHINIEDFAYRV